MGFCSVKMAMMRSDYNQSGPVFAIFNIFYFDFLGVGKSPTLVGRYNQVRNGDEQAGIGKHGFGSFRQKKGLIPIAVGFEEHLALHIV